LTDTPATRVTADWLNSVQSEIANVILARGISLDAKDEGQLLKAVLDIYNYGVVPITLPISNGIKTATDLPIDPFDQSKLKAVYFNALSVRHTTKADMTFMTSHVAVFNTYTSSWSLLTQFDPAMIKVDIQAQMQPTQPTNPPLLSSPANPAPPTAQPDPIPVITMLPGPHFLSIGASGKLQYQTSTLDGDLHQGSLTLSHFRYLRATL
jgi:hypothetical protein